MARITQIQVRRDTATAWTTAQTNAGATPILAAGEIGFETDTGKFKIGDGTSLWGALTYATDGSKLTGTIAAATAITASTATTTTGNAGTATALATARNINGVSFNGTADITVTATPTAGTVVDASISSTLSPSKITNTAATLVQQRNKFYQGTTTLDVPPRLNITTGTAVAQNSLRGMIFVPEQDITVTKISNYVGTTVGVYSTVNTGNPVFAGVSGASTIQFTNGTWSPTFTPVVGMTVSGTGVGTGAKITAYNSTTFTITVDVVNSGTVSGTITLTTTTPQAKAALFTVSGSTFTLITGAVSSWQASPYTSATSLYDFTLTTPTTLTAGTTYAVGMVMTWTGSPVTTPIIATLGGFGSVIFSGTIPPQISFLSTQTDIPSSFTTTTAINVPPFFRLS
jgi:Major tropism determinant N-terminal domain